MVLWPCILKLMGDDELIYLASEQALISECQQLIFSNDDYVIDSTGLCYLLDSSSEKLALIKTAKIVMVDDVTQLIRANEFCKAELCLTKIHFLTIADAFNSLLY